MIEAINLSKTYGNSASVTDISFRVGKGEILGFLGPNGAGKSTTMKMLTGVIQPTSGEARINGVSVSDRAACTKGYIGYLPEAAPVYSEMTVEGFLRFMGGIRGLSHREAKAEMERTTSLLNLVNERRRMLKNLSKGTKQRAAIAQALLGSPPVILLDEPTAGLDPSQINDVRQLIKSLADKHAVIFSTHILPEVELTCSRILIIANGRIATQGTANELTKGGADRVELIVSGDDSLLRQTLTRFVNPVPEFKALDHRWLAQFDLAPKERPALARAIVAAGLDLHSLSEQQTRLEDVFLRAIGRAA